MKKILFILFFLKLVGVWSQNFPFKLGRAYWREQNSLDPENSHKEQYPCETEVKVGDYRPSNCVFDNNFYMYNVYQENFNSKEELPNNWMFSMGYVNTDDVTDQNKGLAYFGDAYNNNNIYIDNGIGYCEIRKEPIQGTHNYQQTNVQTFDFSGGIFNSLFRTRQGVFEAKIKLPDNPYFWPAYWLFNNQEIDIFEFFDNDITSNNWCKTYHQMKMTLHGHMDDNWNTNYATGLKYHCQRDRKFPVPDNFFETDHIYKCVWTDYQVQIYLDGTLVGYTSKFYDGPFLHPSCEKDALDNVPVYHRDCNYMSNSNECSFGFNVPNWPDFWHSHFECFDYKKVKNDVTFPSTLTPMNVIISNGILHNAKNSGYLTQFYNDFDGIDQENRRIGVDWIKVYQPIQCNTPRTICSLEDFNANTGNTNFLSGSVIKIGGPSNCSFTLEEPKASNGWANFPMHVLATESIQIDNTNFSVENGAYARFDIIDCSGGFNQYQRTLPNGEKLFLTDEEIEQIETLQNDSLMITNPELFDSLSTNERRHQYSEVTETKSEIDNGAITIFPNPAVNSLFISMAEEDFNDLTAMEILDNLGRATPINKSSIIDVSSFNSGFYQIKFKFSHGLIVVKNFIIE